MLDTNYSVDILINDKPIRKIPFNGKFYVEARQGQEYSIRIKNNSWQRILAVCSVDGLDILSGKPAIEDAPGYVIPGYMNSKFDGFRLSNEKVAKFVFDYKNTSYAASKGDGSERNVGVIGARLFTEKVKPPVVKEVHHIHHHNPYWWHQYVPPIGTTGQPYPSTPTIWCDTLTRDSDTGARSGSWSNDSINSCADDWMTGELERGLASTLDMDDGSSEAKYCCDNIPTKGTTKGSPLRARSAPRKFGLCSAPEPAGFDMGTKFGESKDSKAIEVDFEKGTLILPTTNIYYASRQSLIEMGIPLGSEKQVSFPEAFPDKYATPPKGWRG